MTDRNAPHSTSDVTVVGKGIHFKGELTGSAPIEVWGTLEGISGTEGTFRVREGGRVQGELAAAQVVIEGRVDGKISAEHKVELKPNCQVRGDVTTRRLAIEEGAFFEGRIHMSGPADAGKP